MDTQRFDDLARTLATPTTRRAGLKLLAGAALGGVLGLRGRAALAAPAITAGPRVVSKTATSAIVQWATDTVSDGRAQFGTTTAYGRTATNPEQAKTHRVKLNGLTPGTLHHYRVRSCRNGACSPFSADAVVRTCPAAQPAFCPGVGCVDTQSDTNHCGTCGTLCPDGQICCQGVCEVLLCESPCAPPGLC